MGWHYGLVLLMGWHKSLSLAQVCCKLATKHVHTSRRVDWASSRMALIHGDCVQPLYHQTQLYLCWLRKASVQDLGRKGAFWGEGQWAEDTGGWTEPQRGVAHSGWHRSDPNLPPRKSGVMNWVNNFTGEDLNCPTKVAALLHGVMEINHYLQPYTGYNAGQSVCLLVPGQDRFGLSVVKNEYFSNIFWICTTFERF